MKNIFDEHIQIINESEEAKEKNRIRKESLSRAYAKAMQIKKSSRSQDEMVISNQIEKMIKINFPSLNDKDISSIIFKVLPPGDIKDNIFEAETDEPIGADLYDQRFVYQGFYNSKSKEIIESKFADKFFTIIVRRRPSGFGSENVILVEAGPKGQGFDNRPEMTKYFTKYINKNKIKPLKKIVCKGSNVDEEVNKLKKEFNNTPYIDLHYRA